MSKLAVVLLAAASVGTGVFTWAFTQNPYVAIGSAGIAGGRLAISIVA